MINGRILGRSFYTTSSSSATLGKTLSLIGVNLNLGQPKVGVEYASQILRKNGVEQLITDCNWRLNSIPDYSQQPFQGTQEVDDSEGVWKAKNHALISQNLQNLNELLDNEMSKNKENFMLFIGGDHSISMGTIPSMVKHRGRTGIVWVDAHADINTPESSPSGNMHGMSLAFLSGIATLPSFHWLKPCIDVSDIVYIGLRDLDDAEKKVIKDLGIKTFTMREIDKLGIGEVMSQCNHHLKDHKNIHMSFDIDAIDPIYAPHTGTAVRGGLNFREANYICEELWSTGRLNSMELVELNTSINPDSSVDVKSSISMALTLIGSSIGRTIL